MIQLEEYHKNPYLSQHFVNQIKPSLKQNYVKKRSNLSFNAQINFLAIRLRNLDFRKIGFSIFFLFFLQFSGQLIHSLALLGEDFFLVLYDFSYTN